MIAFGDSIKIDIFIIQALGKIKLFNKRQHRLTTVGVVPKFHTILRFMLEQNTWSLVK